MATTDFPNAEANYKAIEKLQQEPENKKCADCTASASADGYLCLDFGTFVCFNCAEVHRSIGNTAKKIATNNIRDEDVDLMKKNGNRLSYDKWLVRYTGNHPEPDSTKDRNYRVEYLRLKYIDKKWARADAAGFYVDPDERGGARSRSMSSPSVLNNKPPSAYTSQSNFFVPAPPPPQVQLLQHQQLQQQQLQQQLLINQQHLQAQQMQQQILQQQLHQQNFMLQHQLQQQQQQQQMLLQQSPGAPQSILSQSLPNITPLALSVSPRMPAGVPMTASLGSPATTQPYPQSPTHSSVPPFSLNSPVLVSQPSFQGSPQVAAPYPQSPAHAQPAFAQSSPQTPAPNFAQPQISPRGGGGGAGGGTGGSQEIQKSESLPSLGSRQRSNSRVGICPQCGAGVDSRELGKHKLKDCPFRVSS